MDMRYELQKLLALFQDSADAVAAVEDGQIVFVNPAAAALGIPAGLPAASLLPDVLLSGTSASVPVRIGEIDCHARAAQLDSLTVISLTAFSVSPVINDRVLRELSDSIENMQHSLDILVSAAGSEEDPLLRNHSTSLYRRYYRLRRLHRHLQQCNSLRSSELAFYPQPADLSKLIYDLCDSVSYLTEKSGVTLLCSVQDDLPEATVDVNLIACMVLNILSNSLIHTSEGGHIHVELRQQDSRFILSVTDDGSGIPAGQQTGIFAAEHPLNLSDPSPGTQLGMYLIQQFAALHGGFVLLESRECAGTSLQVSLPVRSEHPPVLHSPITPYNQNGMEDILIELSTAIDKDCFTSLLFD